MHDSTCLSVLYAAASLAEACHALVLTGSEKTQYTGMDLSCSYSTTKDMLESSNMLVQLANRGHRKQLTCNSTNQQCPCAGQKTYQLTCGWKS